MTQSLTQEPLGKTFKSQQMDKVKKGKMESINKLGDVYSLTSTPRDVTWNKAEVSICSTTKLANCLNSNDVQGDRVKLVLSYIGGDIVQLHQDLGK